MALEPPRRLSPRTELLSPSPGPFYLLSSHGGREKHLGPVGTGRGRDTGPSIGSNLGEFNAKLEASGWLTVGRPNRSKDDSRGTQGQQSHLETREED